MSNQDPLGLQPMAIVCAHDPEVEVLSLEYYETAGWPALNEPFVAIAIQSQITSRQIGIHLNRERVKALHDQLGLYLLRMGVEA